MAFTKVAAVGDLSPGQVKQVTVNGTPVALVNVGGTFWAVGDVCPHRGAPLSEGELEGSTLVCPWHGAGFDVTTGAHLCPPARAGVRGYPVRVVGDEVQVDVT